MEIKIDGDGTELNNRDLIGFVKVIRCMFSGIQKSDDFSSDIKIAALEADVGISKFIIKLLTKEIKDNKGDK